MLTLLTFGTLWFWLVTIVAFLIITALVENEKEVCAGFFLVATGLALYFLGNHGILDWIIGHPLTIFWCFLGYLGIACGWGVVKWTLFTHNEADKYQEAKAQFLKDHKAETMTPELKSKWAEHVKDKTYSKDGYSWPKMTFIFPAPEARDFIGKIVGWMTYWPWSAFWTILNDPVRKIMRLFVRHMSGLLNKISKSAYGNVQDDILPPASKKRAYEHDSH